MVLTGSSINRYASGLRWSRFVVFCCALSSPGLVGAQLSGSIERFQSSDTAIESLRWELQQDSDGLTRLHASAASVTIPTMEVMLHKIELQCQAVQFETLGPLP